MRFRPCIDLHQGKVKQIVGSTLSDSGGSTVENYISPFDASYYAELFKKDSLSGGHVIMLGPGNEEQLKEALKAYPMGFQAGGGITPFNARKYLEWGASHVIVTSYIFENGMLSMDKLMEMHSIAGKDKLVIDLSCKEIDGAFYVMSNRWQTVTQFTLTEESLLELSSYCDEFLVHAVDVEGQKKGVKKSLVRLLGGISPVKTTYAGGISSLEDIEGIYILGKGRLDFTIGSALDIFGGTIVYKDLIRYSGSFI